jgi:hypothetical protein
LGIPIALPEWLSEYSNIGLNFDRDEQSNLPVVAAAMRDWVFAEREFAARAANPGRSVLASDRWQMRDDQDVEGPAKPARPP